ncbi:MAG: type I DNA topoisomerase [bacterium]
MKLIIVESPAKARTISKFLGPEYQVAASYGHIRDLPSSAKEVPERYRKESWARLGVDVDNDFDPIYVVSSDNKKHVTELKRLLKNADELLLATDEDREGEAISWHLLEVLDPQVPVRRIAFHEITRSAVEQALAQPREVDRRLVKAQESRRILDRLYGYSLSPVLWKKVRTKLSAGRVQSVAVRLIVEREEERQAFHRAAYWEIEATLTSGDITFPAKLIEVGGTKLAGGKDFDPDSGDLRADKDRLLLDQAAAEAHAAAALANQPWRVTCVEHKAAQQNPRPPFITSTLQQAASAKLGLSPKRTMMIAQRLYEGVDLGGGSRAGLITYMRTDSVTLSEKALAETAEFIADNYGADYTSGPRRYKTKAKTAQEAHEAIRPSNVTRTPEAMARFLNKDELALYSLIWQRTVASQMTPAQLDKTSVDMVADLAGQSGRFRANGSVVRFPGFLRVYGDVQKDTILPELHEDQPVGGGPDAAVTIQAVDPAGHETSPPARYTEATLIRKLEEEGIGRPSTYAPVISTIQARDYVIKKSGALLPSYVGMAVTHLLRQHFRQYIDLTFTAAMETSLDRIAGGEIDAVEFLRNFYQGQPEGNNGLLARIAQEVPNIDYPTIPVGDDPESGQAITLHIGRTYVYARIGEGENSRRATLPLDLLIDELTVAKALEIIQARDRAQEPIGRDPVSGENIYVLVGPYGPYLQLGEAEGEQKPKRIGLVKGTQPTEVDLEKALRLLALPRIIGIDPETDKEITAGIGRFGPYVQRARVFASVENEDILFTITLDEALERIRNKNKKIVLKELGPHPESGIELKVLKGRYGPYVTDGKVNATLSRHGDPTDLTLDEAVQLLATAAERKKTSKKKTVKKKVAKKTGKNTAKKTTKKTAKQATKKPVKKES